MSDKPIPRRLFLKKAGAAGTAAATGLAGTSPPLARTDRDGPPAARSADLILSNAKVITVDPAFTIAQAIAIAGDRILAVGSQRKSIRTSRPARASSISTDRRSCLA